jgi:8-oxo-dGTP diphosphatase
MAGSKASSLANFCVGVDNVIFSVDMEQNRLLVLLILSDRSTLNSSSKNHINLSSDRWCLPHTLVRQTESLEQAAYRILAEKIRVKNLYLEQLFTFDHHSTEIEPNLAELSVSYFAIVRFEEAELIADGVSGIAWYPIDRIPELSANHQRILEYGHRRLRNKLEYSPVAFDVLSSTFTLGDLFQFYTIILGENFSDYSNFRSRLLKLGFLIDTGIKVTRGAGRPASLYRFDELKFSHFKDQPMVFI